MVEESCISSFHKHFNPNCKKTYPLNDLIVSAHCERMWALEEYEDNRFRFNRKKLLKAIPGCSTVLGSEPWPYSDSYSGKQAMEIYIYFLSFFLDKHPYHDPPRCCNECESKRSEAEFRYQWLILSETESYKLHGCFECRQYLCKECGTKILFKTLYRDLNNTNMFHTIKCERCVKIITKMRFRYHQNFDVQVSFLDTIKICGLVSRKEKKLEHQESNKQLWGSAIFLHT